MIKNLYHNRDYILLLIMKISIIALIALILILTNSIVAANDPTTLTFFVDYEEEQEEDYIEASLKVESSSPQLTQALNKAKQIATELASIANAYCKQNMKKGVKGDCKEAVDVNLYFNLDRQLLNSS